VSREKGGGRRRAGWLWLGAAAAVAAGGYLFYNRPGGMELVPGGVITSPAPAGQSSNIPPPFPMPRPGTSAMPPGVKVVEHKVVELNSATLAEVETLPGITPDYARKIIAGRPYRSIADLARTGIPRSILDEISPPAVIRTNETGTPNSTPAQNPNQ
jgi:competence protein ComEA